METKTEQIAGKVRGKAAEHRKSQQDIADIAGISRSAIVARFAGRVAFTATEILLIASALDEPVSAFFPDPDDIKRSLQAQTAEARA